MRVCWGEEGFRTDGGGKCDNFNAVKKGEDFFGHCASCDSSNSLSCTCSSSSARGSHSVFLLVCPVRVTWPRELVNCTVSIIEWSVILIQHTKSNWTS